jgi:hypothetical protein
VVLHNYLEYISYFVIFFFFCLYEKKVLNSDVQQFHQYQNYFLYVIYYYYAQKVKIKITVEQNSFNIGDRIHNLDSHFLFIKKSLIK